MVNCPLEWAIILFLSNIVVRPPYFQADGTINKFIVTPINYVNLQTLISTLIASIRVVVSVQTDFSVRTFFSSSGRFGLN